MAENRLSTQIGQQIFLTGHFDVPVTLEDVRPLGTDGSVGYECRVRLPDGTLEEAVISSEEAAIISGVEEKVAAQPADAERLRLLVESARIRLAYAYDRQFAVSLSGIRTLPHQIEAVYLKMLPQPRLRFLLADDPGAGKTIMAGLLIKELKLREAIDRCLILVPAPLTIQWQDELLRFFNESFQIIHSANDQQQLLNLWERESQVISSIDYAKQDDVRERVWQQRWDLIIIDEAHKCSAYTKRSAGRGDEVERTKRYQLAERLAEHCDNLLLLTATPHHGDDDRFAHFIRLLDRDLFPEPHRSDQDGQIRREILQLGENCPWSLRRLKEDLKDMHGRRLFPDRHVQTVSFNLGSEEYAIYKAVTAFINEYLPQTTGRRKNSVALARTVFQRRLASSTHAIHESLCRRQKKLDDLLRELEDLPPSQRSRRLAQLQGRLSDTEQDEGDLDEATRDDLIDEATAAAELDQLRAEVAELGDLVARVGRVRESGRNSKLIALRNCLQRAEFDELKDGRGKLLIFTEHRDTLNHLRENIEMWGYSTCEIHGGMNPRERKQAQEDFRTSRQICVATEAAGEGINLQFCHLMINYDLPWNPTRLEQRLGRIHRIGQLRDVYAFNFVATSSEDGQPVIEGCILERLLSKLDRMRTALGDRVFDVVGEVLSLNNVNLPDMLREVAYEPRRLDDYLDVIEQIDPELLERYEDVTGIALARAHVDFSTFERANLEAEERRLMPRYVESYFLDAAKAVGLRTEARADGLWRIEHVLADLRSERLAAVRRLGKPDTSYRKLTFYKEHLEQDQHLDAVLLGPGHPVYAAVDEKLKELLQEIVGQTAVYVDSVTDVSYLLHFYEIPVRGQTTKGEPTTIHAELVSVREEVGEGVAASARYSIVPADVLIDLPAHPQPPETLPEIDHGPVSDYVKTTVQMKRRQDAQSERGRYADVAYEYLKKSFEARVRAAQDRIMALRAREPREPEVSLARQRAEQDLVDLERTRGERLAGVDRLRVARQGPLRHVASCLVTPPDTTADRFPELAEELDAGLKRRVELAAEDVVVAYEETQGRECERVGHLKIGFDIRSLAPPDPQTGYRDPVIGVRRIEVKGRKRGRPVRLTTNEWYKAQQLGDTYWLYVVWDPLDNPDPIPLMVKNPAEHLDYAKKEVVAARYYDLPANAVEQAARDQRDDGK
ncbi:MAG: helicase-related protein [Nitrospinae bacterium]|nr:helicase-related protein [Nitrospinota bacterium]